jgi:hypothetical protein
MSWGHGHDDHGGHGGWGGSNAMWECMFGYCKEVSSAAHWVTSMFYSAFLGIFGGWGGGGWHDDHWHH